MEEYRSHGPAHTHGHARAKLGTLVAGCIALAAIAACAATEGDAIILGDGVADAAAPSFIAPPDGAPEAAADLVEYCPSDKCPAGLTTCPNSRFPCDTDLRVDLNNCGACGMACPSGQLGAGRETYACVDGRCVLSCNASAATMDCDNAPDNGCETDPSNDNCGACGKTCTDPAKPCVPRSILGDFGCGCYAPMIPCSFGTFLWCLDPTTDDNNCGACGNSCPRDGGGGLPQPANTYYGCAQSACGALKCSTTFGDCDADPENGCETTLVSDDNCGGCGVACEAGQKCRLDPMGFPQCMCPDGLTFCEMGCFGDTCLGECKDLATDPDNCGTCGTVCVKVGTSTSQGVCEFGTCRRKCAQGRADCNGNAADECEIDTDSDPRNCGGCGKVCDAIAGQACVRGQCVVEPCDKRDAGAVEAR
ncbi:hypothetical protein AKJ09_00907 [Labilithrix luteola]|uniref:Tryptophan synthase alpha chain n=1 Tax=Labilithrix luteola TaxID=1391654 RepID=A0A0K1PL39_9BACT|nr:hypothetical protein [Labilithrix luteola]AKU94243.1 hypothetical protein AKJ09_00907 [Labilithrix luteola]